MKNKIKFRIIPALIILSMSFILSACTKEEADKVTSEIVDTLNEYIQNSVREASEGINDKFDDAKDTVKDSINDHVDSIKDDAQEKLDGLKDEVLDIGGEVKDDIKDRFESTVGELIPGNDKDTESSDKPDEKPEPTSTPEPTATLKPTATPKPTVKPTATPVPTEAPEMEIVEYRFRNKKLLEQHYDKHGKEMGFKSASDYEKAASAVVNNPDALHKIEQEDGDYVFYLEATNEFVIVSTDGYLRTYFLPSAGKKYYDRQ